MAKKQNGIPSIAGRTAVKPKHRKRLTRAEKYAADKAMAENFLMEHLEMCQLDSICIRRYASQKFSIEYAPNLDGDAPKLPFEFVPDNDGSAWVEVVRDAGGEVE